MESMRKIGEEINFASGKINERWKDRSGLSMRSGRIRILAAIYVSVSVDTIRVSNILSYVFYRYYSISLHSIISTRLSYRVLSLRIFDVRFFSYCI